MTRIESKIRLGAIAAAFVGASACGGLLEVENPNNIVEENLGNLTAASAVVNGAEATIARGHGNLMQLVSTTADELFFTGSRDAWLSLDRGFLTDPSNEFTDAAFPQIAEGRWMADLAVTSLEAFVADNPGDAGLTGELGRANLLAALSYMFIGMTFEDYVFSDKKEAGMPIGSANMASVLQSAVAYADAAVANSTGEQLTRALAVRARAKWELAAWTKYNSPSPSSALISDAGADADARAVLDALGGGEDWRYQFTYGPSEVSNAAAGNVNQRSEMQWGRRYVFNGDDDDDPDTQTIDVIGVALMDPVDNSPAPYVQQFIIDEFSTATSYAALTLVSARRMHLQLAESALASGDNAGFVTHINNLRALDGLGAYDGSGDNLAILKYSRMSNLIMEGGRLGDLYRFGDTSDRWQDNSPAATIPGTFFPITSVEILSNPNVG